MENTVYVLACSHCNKIATEDEIVGKEDSDEAVTCTCGCTLMAAVKIPESMADESYLVVEGELE
jgi:hypothetical protein